MASLPAFNWTAERWLGYIAADVIGQNCPDAWHDPGECVPRAAAFVRRTRPSGSRGARDVRCEGAPRKPRGRRMDLDPQGGSRFPVWLFCHRSARRRRYTVGYVRVIADITKRKIHDAAHDWSEGRFPAARSDDAPIGMALMV